MIRSRFIYDILDLMLDGDQDGFSARNQLPFLTDESFEYTQGGVTVNFSYDAPVENHRVATDDLILSGVFIESGEYLIQAEATLFFSDGLADYLEIWCHRGEYPKHDLTRYTLTQDWDDDLCPGRVITTEE